MGVFLEVLLVIGGDYGGEIIFPRREY